MKRITLFFLLSGVGVIILLTIGSNFPIKNDLKEKVTTIKNQDKGKRIQPFQDDNSDLKPSKEQTPFYEPSISFALEIKGDEEFKTKIRNAVRLLWLYDKENSFRLLRRYIFEIRQSHRTCFSFDGEKPIIEISDNMSKNSSTTYLASVIAHNLWHGWYLIQKKTKKKKTEIPHPKNQTIKRDFVNPFGDEFKKYEDLFAVEEEATKYQIRILEIINAPQSEIKRLLTRDKKDFSHAHDGNFLVQY